MDSLAPSSNWLTVLEIVERPDSPFPLFPLQHSGPKHFSELLPGFLPLFSSSPPPRKWLEELGKGRAPFPPPPPPFFFSPDLEECSTIQHPPPLAFFSEGSEGSVTYLPPLFFNIRHLPPPPPLFEFRPPKRVSLGRMAVEVLRESFSPSLDRLKAERGR